MKNVHKCRVYMGQLVSVTEFHLSTITPLHFLLSHTHNNACTSLVLGLAEHPLPMLVTILENAERSSIWLWEDAWHTKGVLGGVSE